MFRRLTDKPLVSITVDGHPILAEEGETVAAALLSQGRTAVGRRPMNHRQRGPYCLMGTCFECLVEIDGVTNRQACMTRVSRGMQITTQQ